jgi:hypothetical protein
MHNVRLVLFVLAGGCNDSPDSGGEEHLQKMFHNVPLLHCCLWEQCCCRFGRSQDTYGGSSWVDTFLEYFMFQTVPLRDLPVNAGNFASACWEFRIHFWGKYRQAKLIKRGGLMYRDTGIQTWVDMCSDMVLAWRLPT